MEIQRNIAHTIETFLFLLLCVPIGFFILTIYFITGEDMILLTIDKLALYTDKISQFINGQD